MGIYYFDFFFVNRRENFDQKITCLLNVLGVELTTHPCLEPRLKKE